MAESVLDGTKPLTRASNSGGLGGYNESLSAKYGQKNWLYSFGRKHEKIEDVYEWYFGSMRSLPAVMGDLTSMFDKYYKMMESWIKFDKKKRGEGGIFNTIHSLAPHFFDFKIWKKFTGQARKPELAALHQIRDLLVEVNDPDGKKGFKSKFGMDPQDFGHVIFNRIFKGGLKKSLDNTKQIMEDGLIAWREDSRESKKMAHSLEMQARDARKEDARQEKHRKARGKKQAKAEKLLVQNNKSLQESVKIGEKDLAISKANRKDAKTFRSSKDPKKDGGSILGKLLMFGTLLGGLIGSLFGPKGALIGALTGFGSVFFLTVLPKLLLSGIGMVLSKVGGIVVDVLKGAGSMVGQLFKGNFKGAAKMFGGGLLKVAKGGGIIGAILGFVFDALDSVKQFAAGDLAGGFMTLLGGKKGTHKGLGGFSMAVAGQMLKWGMLGFTIGTAFPGIGNVVGLVIGLALGAGLGIWQNKIEGGFGRAVKDFLTPKSSGDATTGSFGQSLKFAIMGAMIGSAIPGAGTVAGAILGWLWGKYGPEFIAKGEGFWGGIKEFFGTGLSSSTMKNMLNENDKTMLQWGIAGFHEGGLLGAVIGMIGGMAGKLINSKAVSFVKNIIAGRDTTGLGGKVEGEEYAKDAYGKDIKNRSGDVDRFFETGDQIITSRFKASGFAESVEQSRKLLERIAAENQVNVVDKTSQEDELFKRAFGAKQFGGANNLKTAQQSIEKAFGIKVSEKSIEQLSKTRGDGPDQLRTITGSREDFLKKQKEEQEELAKAQKKKDDEANASLKRIAEASEKTAKNTDPKDKKDKIVVSDASGRELYRWESPTKKAS